MIRRVLTLTGIAAVLWAGGAAPGLAQLQRPAAALEPVAAADAAHAGATIRVAVKASLPDGLHVQSNAPRDASLVATVLTIEAPPGIEVREIAYPPAQPFGQVGQDDPLDVFDHEFVIGVDLAVAASVAPGEVVVPAQLRYQACNDQMCFAPTTTAFQWTLRVVPASATPAPQHQDVFAAIVFGRGGGSSPAGAPAAGGPAPSAPAAGDDGLARLDGFTVAATSGGYMNVETFLGFVKGAETGAVQKGLFDGKGPFAILLIVFLGGLALNLTPCVLPMIPINLAIIGAGAQAGSRGRGFLLGSVYGAAMAIVYGVLGLVVILTAGSFGTINASPWFNAAIAAIFVVLALAMFDVIPIDFSRFASGVPGGDTGRGTIAVAFTMGTVAALLAGACVAPVVIQVVLFASNLYATGTTLALALPFVLGIGMAVPWPLAGAGIAALPKPGAWMVRVKQAFGVLILATAVYYGYLGYTLFANRWVDAGAVASSVEAKLKAGWHASLAEGLAAAERERKPVLIDLWATWCKNCLTMDQTTFEDPAVVAALSGYVKIKVQAEDPDRDPARAVMQRFKAVGLPTYVILRPRGRGAGSGTE